MNRTTRLLGTLDRSQQIIELGAGYNPIAPKSDGWQTHVVDHATRDELRAKYAAAGVDVDVIEDVDTVWRGGPLDQAVPAALLGQVDMIIASHVLEHIPDLIGFFQSASRLVRAGGSLAVALPDRRYCFDCYKPWTTTGDLLESHGVGLKRHTLKTAYNHMAYSASAESQLGWGPRPVEAPVLMDPFAPAATIARHYRDDPDAPYQDFHAWQLTPAGFRLILMELAEIGLIDWQVEYIHGPENFEFFVGLRRTGGQPWRTSPVAFQAQRQDLLLLQLSEAREQIDFILGGGGGGNRALSEKLTEQDASLAEMAETLAWLRAQLGPAHRELTEKLSEQDGRLREMGETLAWLRALLSPVRTIWRILRRVR